MWLVSTPAYGACGVYNGCFGRMGREYYSAYQNDYYGATWVTPTTGFEEAFYEIVPPGDLYHYTPMVVLISGDHKYYGFTFYSAGGTFSGYSNFAEIAALTQNYMFEGLQLAGDSTQASSSVTNYFYAAYYTSDYVPHYQGHPVPTYSDYASVTDPPISATFLLYPSQQAGGVWQTTCCH